MLYYFFIKNTRFIMIFLELGDAARCPHCGKAQKLPVAELVTPGHCGQWRPRSYSCHACAERYQADKVSDDCYIIEALVHADGRYRLKTVVAVPAVPTAQAA